MHTFTKEEFKLHFRNFSMYQVAKNIYIVSSLPQDEAAQQFIARQEKAKVADKALQSLHIFRPGFLDSLEFLKRISDGYTSDAPRGKTSLENPGDDIPPSAAMVAEHRDILTRVQEELRAGDQALPIDDYIHLWRNSYLAYMRGELPEVEEETAYIQTAPEAEKASRSGPRPQPKDLFAIHSSAPVYDIGETIARGVFTLPENGRFPTAEIIGKTQGRIELLPFWDHQKNQPLTPQNVHLAANAQTAEFTRMQEEAITIATSYNEEMATFFYAMDAYWLTHAKSPEDYVELQIADLLQYSGKKPVKSHGRYTGTFRADQLQRAGMMVYGMGFSMVEIERAIVKGVGERTHYKRLWEVSDMYMMKTLDDESYIESLTYRPNEVFRGASFGSRRETALLMGKVLGLDYAKMVTARRLGRYYTWLWRDRAYAGNIAAPISCALLLERAGIEVEKGRERYARRSLERALDRLEVEGIISQWVLYDIDGSPADASARISFSRWLEMKISVSPPDVILEHYAAGITAPQRLQQAAPSSQLDLARLNAEKSRRGLTLAMISEETGVELSTLSRILAGKTKRPRAEHVKALNKWMAAE